MTHNTLKIVLECNGMQLAMGPGEALDITAVTGLESSELEISTSQNALVDGETVDGKKIKARPIHIEARFRSNAEGRRVSGIIIIIISTYAFYIYNSVISVCISGGIILKVL